MFVGFFAAVYGLYLLSMRRLAWQNRLLLAASLLFYGAWDWRFLFLLVGTALVDWLIARAIEGSEDGRRRRRLLIISMVSNLGVLGFFKYFDFFADSAQRLANAFGVTLGFVELHIILPVGISFYTFQSMSYTIDVWRREMPACKRFDDFLLFVAFFPQLVAGPIERARVLLPQVMRPRTITAAGVDAGLWLILQGYLKKVVIADNLSPIADAAFASGAPASGPAMWIGVVAFAFQIYGDFSGYSDIARGTARLMGFELMINFRLPYFAASPSDFWRRWHISLSTWLRDYLYIPLGGNRGSATRTQINLALTMLLGGLWHGASWNFVLWGAFHGGILVVYRLIDGDRRPGPGRWWALAPRIAIMFLLTLVGWVLFRCHTMADIASVAGRLCGPWNDVPLPELRTLLACCLPLLALEAWLQRRGDLLAPCSLPWPAKSLLYAAVLATIAICGVREAREFIYFQF